MFRSIMQFFVNTSFWVKIQKMRFELESTQFRNKIPGMGSLDRKISILSKNVKRRFRSKIPRSVKNPKTGWLGRKYPISGENPENGFFRS